MANVNSIMNNSVSLSEFARAIELCGTKITFVGQGQPGIGKSSVLKVLGERFKDTHDTAYVDMAMYDVGDMQMPYVADGAFTFLPNTLFLSKTLNRPMIVMLDEFGKANRSVKTAFMPLLLEHRLGGYHLPEGSIVFATTNLVSDGVGDLLESHGKNRVCVVNIRNPEAEEWITGWAINNGIDEAVQQFVREYPHCMASYTDPAQKDNHMIFQPSRHQDAFVTPRSLEKVSHAAKQRGVLSSVSPNLFHSILCGLVGAPAAAEMRAFFDVADKLTPWAEIMKDPKKADLPTSALQQQLLTQRAVTQLKKEEVDTWLTYMERMKDEIQAMFFSQITASNKLVEFQKSEKFFKLLEEKHTLFLGG